MHMREPVLTLTDTLHIAWAVTHSSAYDGDDGIWRCGTREAFRIHTIVSICIAYWIRSVNEYFTAIFPRMGRPHL